MQIIRDLPLFGADILRSEPIFQARIPTFGPEM
jgi:hypothetical protein